MCYSSQEAIKIAIESVELRTDLSEASRRETLKKLKALSKNVWQKSWNQKTIVEAIHKFKEEHGRVPNTADLHRDELPSLHTIQAHFHLAYSTFIAQEFPEYRFYHINPKADRYAALTKEEWLAFFAEQFNKHLCPEMNGRVYNQLRDSGTPTWDTIARYTGDIQWSKLMKSAGVKYLGCRGIETAQVLLIENAKSPVIDKLESINSERRVLNEELKQILQTRVYSDL